MTNDQIGLVTLIKVLLAD